MAVKLSPKYQVVIPEDVRTILGLRVGAKIEVIAKGGIAYLVPVPDLTELQEQFAGLLDQKAVRVKKDRNRDTVWRASNCCLRGLS